MLYVILKIWVRLAALIFCRNIIINKKAGLKEEGPLLLACNHPNSFLGSVILDILFEKPVWSLARGDAFINKKVSVILKRLKIMPVYRTSEGVENLTENYKTFAGCINIFKANGIVQIYSEGKCINEWHLRPLKKGSARLAIKAWEENIPLSVLPVGINYSSFRSFGKNVFINFGNVIIKSDINWNDSDGIRHASFNNLLAAQMKALIFEIGKNDRIKQSAMLQQKPSILAMIVLFIPAIAGWLANAPLYIPVKKAGAEKYSHTDHYDAVLTILLVFAYPFYLLLLIVIAGLITKSAWVFAIIILVPFAAWNYVYLKQQLDK